MAFVWDYVNTVNRVRNAPSVPFVPHNSNFRLRGKVNARNSNQSDPPIG
jgi:hypothetical protein